MFKNVPYHVRLAIHAVGLAVSGTLGICGRPLTISPGFPLIVSLLFFYYFFRINLSLYQMFNEAFRNRAHSGSTHLTTT